MIFKVALVVSEFNKEITDNLVKGAEQEYSKIFRLPLGNFKNNFDIYRIPGAFELPGTIHKILKSNKKYHGIIAFGSIIKGDTAHFEYISNSVSSALMELNIRDDINIPIMFGVLTTYNYEQALSRSKYIGNDIMKSTIDTIKVYEQIN